MREIREYFVQYLNIHNDIFFSLVKKTQGYEMQGKEIPSKATFMSSPSPRSMRPSAHFS